MGKMQCLRSQTKENNNRNYLLLNIFNVPKKRTRGFKVIVLPKFLLITHVYVFQVYSRHEGCGSIKVLVLKEFIF